MKTKQKNNGAVASRFFINLSEHTHVDHLSGSYVEDKTEILAVTDKGCWNRQGIEISSITDTDESQAYENSCRESNIWCSVRVILKLAAAVNVPVNWSLQKKELKWVEMR